MVQIHTVLINKAFFNHAFEYPHIRPCSDADSEVGTWLRFVAS